MGGNRMKRVAFSFCLLLIVAVALVAQTGKHRKIFSSALSCSPGPLPHYVGSTSVAALITTTDTFSYSSTAGSLLIIGSINDSLGGFGITNITDSGGNIWHNDANDPPFPDFWYSNAAVAVTSVTVTVAGNANYKIALGEYAQWTSVSNANNVCNHCSQDLVAVAGNPVAGFISYYDTSGVITSFTGPYAGGTVRQSLAFGTATGGGMALMDNISSVGTISQGLGSSVYYMEAIVLADGNCNF
jgi:hypothetical protein